MFAIQISMQHPIHGRWHFQVLAASGHSWSRTSSINPWKLRFWVLTSTVRVIFTCMNLYTQILSLSLRCHPTHYYTSVHIISLFVTVYVYNAFSMDSGYLCWSLGKFILSLTLLQQEGPYHSVWYYAFIGTGTVSGNFRHACYSFFSVCIYILYIFSFIFWVWFFWLFVGFLMV